MYITIHRNLTTWEGKSYSNKQPFTTFGSSVDLSIPRHAHIERDTAFLYKDEWKNPILEGIRTMFSTILKVRYQVLHFSRA